MLDFSSFFPLGRITDSFSSSFDSAPVAEQWRRLKRIYFASELNGPSDFSLSTSDASFRERNSRPTNLTVRPKKTAFPHSLVNSMLKLQRVNQLTPLRHSRANFNAILSCTLFIFRLFFFSFKFNVFSAKIISESVPLTTVDRRAPLIISSGSLHRRLEKGAGLILIVAQL